MHLYSTDCLVREGTDQQGARSKEDCVDQPATSIPSHPFRENDMESSGGRG